MKVLAKVLLIVILGVSFMVPIYAQESLWDELNDKVVTHFINKDGIQKLLQ